MLRISDTSKFTYICRTINDHLVVFIEAYPVELSSLKGFLQHNFWVLFEIWEYFGFGGDTTPKLGFGGDFHYKPFI